MTLGQYAKLAKQLDVKEPGHPMSTGGPMVTFKPNAVLKDAAAMIRAQAAEIERIKGRLCLSCGKTAPATHDRGQPGPDCPATDACTFDLTLDEAWQHWRGVARKERERAKAAESAARTAYARGIEDAAKAVAEKSDAARQKLAQCVSEGHPEDGHVWSAIVSHLDLARNAIRALAPDPSGSPTNDKSR